MQHIISKIQNDGVVWLQDSVLRIYRPSPTDFVHALHKVYTIYLSFLLIYKTLLNIFVVYYAILYRVL